jgi:hypothetical protein
MLRLAALLSSLVFPQIAHADCAIPRMQPGLALGGVVPPSGALAVKLVNTWDGEPGQRKDPLLTLTASLRRDDVKIALITEQLAPGLARLVPARKPPTGEWTVDGLPGVVKVVFDGDDPPPLPTPVAAAIKQSERQGQGRRAPRLIVTVTAELATPAPAGTLGVILYEGDKPVGWNPAGPTDTQIVVWQSKNDCEPEVNGAQPTRGAKYRLAFIDRAGRVSAKSAPIQVTK